MIGVSAMKMFMSFKEKFLAAMQKVVVLFLAIIMLVFFLPVGLVPEPDFNNESGELVRLMPDSELYSDDNNENNLRKIGLSHSAYYTFNLDGLADTDVDDINSVRFRISFVKGSGGINNAVEISTLADGIRPDRAVIGAGAAFFETKFAQVYPQTTGADDSLCEIDMTDYVKERLEKGKTELSLRVTGRTPVCLYMADGGYDDPMYRPCLKIATGVSTDTEAQTLKRAELHDAVYVSQAEAERSGESLTVDNTLRVGGGNEIYLRFELNEAAIIGSVHSAVLSLDKLGDEESRVKIYCINNDEWTGESISYSKRPRGNESTAFTSLSAPTGADGRISFDVTQAVCEARNSGITSLTFRITCDDEIAFSGKQNPKLAPQLYLKASDDADIVCASEAALKALGANKASFVTMKLPEEYVSSGGTDAGIRWTEYDTDGKEVRRRHISPDGEVTRPKWFEGDCEVLAVAEIRSGKYRSRRQFSLTVPAEAAPDYSKYKFGNYIDIGTGKSEEGQKFEFVDVSGTKRRWADGRMFTYRVPEEGGVMVLNFSCMPDTDNYLTLKLWEGDRLYSGFSLEVCGAKTNDKLVLSAPTGAADTDGGFVYATYALPRSFTDGKTHISLRLTCAQTEEELSARGIYAAYLTQSAFFEPKQFAKQGEKSISEPSFGERAIMKFIENLKSLAIPINLDGAPENEEQAAEQTRQLVSADADKGSVVIAGEEVNIAFSIDEAAKTAVIYQRLEYYDRYSSGCPVIDADGVTVIDYGDYKLAWNKSDEAKPLPYNNIELSGAYKEIISQTYCTFSEEWQMMDDSVIPEGTVVSDGREMIIDAGETVLLVHVAEPMHTSDWRVSQINGRNISDLSFGPNEKIESVTIKSVGGISSDVNEANVFFSIYEDEKIISIGRRSVPVTESINIYTVDLSEYEMYMRKGLTMRVFVYDNTEALSELAPKLELP